MRVPNSKSLVRARQDLVFSTPISTNLPSTRSILPEHEFLSPIVPKTSSGLKSAIQAQRPSTSKFSAKTSESENSSWETLQQQQTKKSPRKNVVVHAKENEGSDSSDEVMSRPSQKSKHLLSRSTKKSETASRKNFLAEETSDDEEELPRPIRARKKSPIKKKTTFQSEFREYTKNLCPDEDSDNDMDVDELLSGSLKIQEASKIDLDNEDKILRVRTSTKKKTVYEPPSFVELAHAKILSNSKNSKAVKSNKKVRQGRGRIVNATEPPLGSTNKRQTDVNREADTSSCENGESLETNDSTGSSKRRKLHSQIGLNDTMVQLEKIDEPIHTARNRPTKSNRLSKIPTRTRNDVVPSIAEEGRRKSSRARVDGAIQYWNQRLNYTYKDGLATLNKKDPLCGDVKTEEEAQIRPTFVAGKVPVESKSDVPNKKQKVNSKTAATNKRTTTEESDLNIAGAMQLEKSSLAEISSRMFKREIVGAESLFWIKPHRTRTAHIVGKTFMRTLSGSAKYFQNGKAVQADNGTDLCFKIDAKVTITNASQDECCLVYCAEVL